MSLVVARQSGDAVYLVGDTQMTFPWEQKSRPEEGIIKLPILRRDLCVGIAGEIAFADGAVASLAASTVTRDAIVAHFVDWHRRSDGKTDFIVAFGPPDANLVQVKAGTAEQVATSWIGFQSAFS